jgi:voltage-gated potassium channel
MIAMLKRNEQDSNRPLDGWRLKFHATIFEAETISGKFFDVILLSLIILSVTIVMLETVGTLEKDYAIYFKTAEWVITILFSVEYVFRLLSVKKPFGYVFSFYGIIDLLSILPTYLALFFTGAQSFMIIRIFRFLRVFRILKLARYLGEAKVLGAAIKSSIPKITIFLLVVFSMSLIAGTLMYYIEGKENGFPSIPHSWYWAVVTMTTVGYGDMTPKTPFGQFLASIIMMAGYGILAVPTGIVSTELAFYKHKDESSEACPSCCEEGHDKNAQFCFKCGEKLN